MVADNGATTSIHLTTEDRHKIERIMVKRGITSRSEYFRKLVQNDVNGVDESDINGTPPAGVLRAEIAGPANRQAPMADHPSMTVRAYDLALVVARARMAEIRKGKLPMVEDDIREAWLDPYAERTWELYMDVLPKFFKVLLGLDGPPNVEVRYGPLDMVDGQYAETVQGEVRYCRIVHQKTGLV